MSKTFYFSFYYYFNENIYILECHHKININFINLKKINL